MRRVVYKRRAVLPPDEADGLLSGELCGRNQIEREIGFSAGRYEGLAPRAFVAYDREAFFDPNDHEFRMTFDRRVRARWDRLALSEGDDGEELLDEGVSILEVKCLEGMPLWLVRHLSAEGIRKASCSKYGTACERHLAGASVPLGRRAQRRPAHAALPDWDAWMGTETTRTGALVARG